MYQVEDYIIYGNEGVCQIEAIEMLDLLKSGKEKAYYVLQPVYRNGTVYTPVDTKVFMRHVITEEAANDLIDQMPSIRAEASGPTNASILKNKYTAAIQENNATDLIQLIKSIYKKAAIAQEKNKKMGQTDKFFLRKAEDLLYGELAVALDMPRNRVRDHVEQRLADLARK